MLENHRPVLLEEVMGGLEVQPNGMYVDATFGRGGHSFSILQRLGPNGRLMALDKDPLAVAVGKSDPFSNDPRFRIVHSAFTDLEKVVQNCGWYGQVNGVLLDLGVSSPQLDEARRGFSFTKDGPLDMRMNPEGRDAATWINQADEAEICWVLREYGEERYAKRIASYIVKARQVLPITRTLQLSEIVTRASPAREKKKHPATRTFQAIRIFINNELEELRTCLSQCLNVLSIGGRLCVISFHSLEDRIVKQFIQRESQGDALPRDLPILAKDIVHRMRKIGSLIRPSALEVKSNPRARSARLRIAEKLA